MDRFSIRELRGKAGGQPLQAVVHAQTEAIQEKSAKSGNVYLELKLADAEDSFTLRLWSDSAAFTTVRRLMGRPFLEVAGSWTQNQFGLDAKDPAIRELTEEEIAALVAGPTTLREKQDADYASISSTCDAMADPRLRGLCRKFLDEHGDRFRRTAAAREYHHARRGGLVEHVAQMMRTAVAISTAYPHLNRDLIVAGVLFHDCGKLWENSYPPHGFAMPYNERGEMLGHITIGIELVNNLWRQLVETPEAAGWIALDPPNEDVRLHLLHLIASHHGELQFGSPVWPKTPEAIVLHHVDNIDAKLEMMAEAYATSAHLGRNIVERRRPLPANLLRPLGRIGDTAEPKA